MHLETELNLDAPFSDIRHETVLNVVWTAHHLAAAGAALFRQFGLTEAQFNVLYSIKHRHGDLTQTDLGKRLVVTRASITSVLDKLEAKKLVARKSVPGNRRIYHVELTADGRRVIDAVEPRYRHAIHEATRTLTEKDCKKVIACLEAVRAQLRGRDNA